MLDARDVIELRVDAAPSDMASGVAITLGPVPGNATTNAAVADVVAGNGNANTRGSTSRRSGVDMAACTTSLHMTDACDCMDPLPLPLDELDPTLADDMADSDDASYIGLPSAPIQSAG